MESGISQLKQVIAEKAAAVAAKEHELELARVELQALQHAASLLKLSSESISAARSSSHLRMSVVQSNARGKLAGTLSNRWRQVMALVAETGNHPTPPDGWVVAGEAAGFKLSPTATADWLRRGVGAKMGFIERIGNDYRVSQKAIQKFGFKTAKPPPEVPSNGFA